MCYCTAIHYLILCNISILLYYHTTHHHYQHMYYLILWYVWILRDRCWSLWLVLIMLYIVGLGIITILNISASDQHHQQYYYYHHYYSQFVTAFPTYYYYCCICCYVYQWIDQTYYLYSIQYFIVNMMIVDIMSVSYTHLDVYKRQFYYFFY